MSEWKEVLLSDFIKVKHGYAFKGEFITEQENDQILVTPGNFKIGGGFKSQKFKYYADTAPDDYILKTGDIVVTMTDLSKETDTLGYSAKIPASEEKKFLHNQRVGLVQFISDQISKDFIYWLLRTKEYQWFIVGSASGTSVMHTSPSRILEYQFNIPEFETQQKIANVLSSIENKIDLLYRQNKTLEQMSETLFRQWFVVEAKEDWEIVKLGSLVSTNSSSINKEYSFEHIEYLDTGSLTQGHWDTLQPYLLKEAPSRAKRLVQHNDILYSTVRPNQLHYGIVRNPINNLVVSTGFCVIRCDSISPYFIYYLLTESGMTEYLHSVADGSTSAYPSLKPSDIEAVEFSLPPPHTLENYHSIIDSYWNKIETNHNQIRTLENLRDTLLPKLMSGEVTISSDE